MKEIIVIEDSSDDETATGDKDVIIEANQEWNVVVSRRNTKQNDKKIKLATFTTAARRTDIPASSSSTSSPLSLYMIMLIGIPGSGKSHFSTILLNRNPHKFVRISQDVLRTRNKCEEACREALLRGKVPIVDRCNFNPMQRQFFLMIASEYNVAVDGILFDYPKEDCIVRCEERAYHETLDKSDARRVVAMLASQFHPPCEQTDADKFRCINKVSSFQEANEVAYRYGCR